ncbi:MAG: 4Fe-4S binding protein [Lachnospiraceae bacterium]|nr:4Fe-4S binding protein [Lachnospiraceae bacterium]
MDRDIDIDEHRCLACGTCIKSCPMEAIHIWNDRYAMVISHKCNRCGKCIAACPVKCISRQNNKSS